MTNRSPQNCITKHMRCRHCASKNTRVTVTEGKHQTTVRYCRCLDCEGKFKTIERYAVPKSGAKKGCDNPRSFFEPHDVAWIRKQHKAGVRNADIARKMRVDPTIISKIVRGKTYQDVA